MGACKYEVAATWSATANSTSDTGRGVVEGEMIDAARGRPLRWMAWIVGTALCLTQFVSPRSFWVDELAVVRNLVDRRIAELVSQPLDYDQVAPAGFLAIEKAVVETFGATELALRAYPLAMALVALALMGRLGRIVVGGWASAVPMLLLGSSAQMIWLSSQVKQYSTDAAVTAALLLVGVTVPSWRERDRWRRLVLLLGVVVPWFSQPAVFSLAAAALALVLDDWRRTRRLSPFTLGVAFAWGLSGIAALVSARARVAPDTMDFMRHYWQSGFAPIPPTSWNDWKWPAYTLRTLVRTVVNDGWSYAYLGVAVLGGWVLWRRSRLTAVVLLVPLVAALGAAAARLYPLAGRLGFFLSPIVVILLGAGIDTVVRWWRGPRWTRAVLGVLLVVAPLGMLARRPPPFITQHVRPLLETLRANLRPGDRVYVPYGGWQAWSHYAPAMGIAADVVLGTCHGLALTEYEREVERLRGARRAWILFIPAGELQRADDILHIDGRLGTRRGRWVQEGRDAQGAAHEISLELYDMTPVAGGSDASYAAAPSPPAAECRGAAVDRRLPRSPP